ncbi:MAG: hypothetical protein GY861_13285 [bacterium]|nr:hypothetical protein [bacterium]
MNLLSRFWMSNYRGPLLKSLTAFINDFSYGLWDFDEDWDWLVNDHINYDRQFAHTVRNKWLKDYGVLGSLTTNPPRLH